jgi:hypothetical protein
MTNLTNLYFQGILDDKRKEILKELAYFKNE